jgi:hypothetical protein
MDVLPEKARSTLIGSSIDWEKSRETFPLDLTMIMKYLSQQRASKQNLLAASTMSLWLLSNFFRAQLGNEDELWPNFVPILNEFARTYRGILSNADYDRMKEAVNSFMKGEKEAKQKLAQPLPVEQKEETLLDYYIKLAADLSEEFDRKLRSFNKQAFSVPKKKERAKEKADLPTEKGGYDGDCSCVLDYLRGTVFIDVNKATSSANLRNRFDMVIVNLLQEIGPIERQKIYLMDDNQGPPRILLNLRFQKNSLKKDFICEVQIRFSLYGFDASFQDFLHMVYELERKPMKDINWKPHILELSKEMLGKSGIESRKIFSIISQGHKQ